MAKTVYNAKSVDGGVTWDILPETGGLVMIDQRGQKHKYTALDTQRLMLLLDSCREVIDRGASEEQKRIDNLTPNV